MESYQPEQLLVYDIFLKHLNLWRTYSTSGIGLLHDPPFYCNFFFSNDNSFRRLLLFEIVLRSLLVDAIDDPIQPTQTRFDLYAVVAFALKDLFSFRT